MEPIAAPTPTPASILRPLVIGVGNRDRGDDAVGPVVVDVLRQRCDDRFATMVAEGDLSDLALQWHADQEVVIVDAVVSGEPPGHIIEIDALRKTLPTDSGLVSSHGVGVGEAIELGRLLGRLPRKLTVIGIEVTSCEQFDEMTEVVAAAALDVAGRIERI